MARRSKKRTLTGKSGDILDLIPDMKLHPWESVESFKALEEALIAQFDPATALELSIVKRLAANEWEQHRTDRLRADITRASLRKLAISAMLRWSMSAYPGEAERELAKALIASDDKLRASAQQAMEEMGTSVEDLHADAYLGSFQEFEALERRSDVFDRRRRDLMEDLRALQTRRQQAQVEDAQLVDANGN